MNINELLLANSKKVGQYLKEQTIIDSDIPPKVQALVIEVLYRNIRTFLKSD